MQTIDSLEHSAPGLLNQLQAAIHAKQFAPRTGHNYQHWISRYVFFHGLQNPAKLDERNVREFIAYLANSLKASPAKQNQALSALDFFYAQVLNKPLRGMGGLVKVSKPRRLRLLPVRTKKTPPPTEDSSEPSSVEA